MDCPDVRLAVIEDRPAIVALTTQLHGENGLFRIAPDKVDRMIDRYFDRKGAVIGVIGEIGNPVATIYMGLDQLIYTDDWALVEQWNFVHPDHRRSNYARQLIAYAKKTADALRVPLMVGILSNKRTEAKARLYEQMLERAGSYFIYGIEYLTVPAWRETDHSGG